MLSVTGVELQQLFRVCAGDKGEVNYWKEEFIWWPIWWKIAAVIYESDKPVVSQTQFQPCSSHAT